LGKIATCCHQKKYLITKLFLGNTEGGTLMGQIFYFSGTGNSLVLARKLAADLGAEVKSIAAYLENPVDIETDILGIVTPVYCLDVPPVVAHFLQVLRLKNTPYIFAVANMGATSGETLGSMKKLLAGRGMKMQAGFTVPMPDCSIVFPSPEKLKQEMLAKLPERLSTIVFDVKAKRENDASLSTCPVCGFVNKTGWVVMDNILSVKSRSVSQEKCIGCGICAQVCPAHCITIKDAKPVFGAGCYSCFACAQWCPQNAISVGFLTPGSHSKYTNNEVTSADLEAANKI
jgi:NAD-dependent dihydropyrimidine dehydrogenase PreA subunit/flavodoxin